MKLNQSLTAAITAAALVAGAGFAYAQTSAPQVTNTPDASSAQGPIMQNQGTGTTAPGSMNSNSTLQNQPSSSMDNSNSSMGATSSTDTTLEPRADRN